jgi:hypothetical protein
VILLVSLSIRIVFLAVAQRPLSPREPRNLDDGSVAKTTKGDSSEVAAGTKAGKEVAEIQNPSPGPMSGKPALQLGGYQRL